MIDQLLRLTKSLYPTGRAFRVPFAGILEAIHKALAESEDQVLQDSLSVLDSLIPDNANFTAEDASNWERRLGLISNPLVSLSDRKDAIIRKMNHPGVAKARQHYLYVEGELRKAGFLVRVYENRFDDGFGNIITKTPGEVCPGCTTLKAHGAFTHGSTSHGSGFLGKIANSILQSVDQSFDFGVNLRATFYISGDTLSTIVDIPAERESEFRQLVLKLKPVHSVAIHFVNFVV